MEKPVQNKKILFVMIAIFVLLFAYVTYSIIQNNKNKKMEETNISQDTATTTARISVAGDIIVINYKGTLENGIEFDSSYKRGQPFVFQVGVGQVIKGWDEGLIGVKRGDKKQLIIPGEKAYGAQEIKGPDGKVLIPKNATLIFDVEVVEVISEADAQRMMAEQQAAQGSSTQR